MIEARRGRWPAQGDQPCNFDLQLGNYITQILREINLGECRSSKTAVLVIFKGSEFCSSAEQTRQPKAALRVKQRN